MKKYSLYALPVTEKNIDVVVKERFSKMTADYILIYSNNEVESGLKLKDENLNRLSESDKQWLQDCNLILISEESIKKKDEIMENVKEKLDELERLLTLEKEKISGEDK